MKIKTPLARLATLTVLLFLLPGCASTHLTYLEPDAFVRQGKEMERVSSAQWVRVVGASRTRAYLEYQDLLTWNGKPRTVVYWTRLDELPDEIQRPLKSGQSPWSPATNTNARVMSAPLTK